MRNGERQNGEFQLCFNPSLKADFQGSRVTSDGGLILVGELNHRRGFAGWIEELLRDCRRGKNMQFPLGNLLCQSVYNHLAGYKELNDAGQVCRDATFPRIGSERVWDRGVVLTSRLQSFRSDMLAEEKNSAGVASWERARTGGNACRLGRDRGSLRGAWYDNLCTSGEQGERA